MGADDDVAQLRGIPQRAGHAHEQNRYRRVAPDRPLGEDPGGMVALPSETERDTALRAAQGADLEPGTALVFRPQ